MNLDRSRKWIEEYKKLGALWLHDGDPKRPHALLTSGMHSRGFFNSGLVTEDPSLIRAAGVDLAGAVAERLVGGYYIDYVVGPAMGAVVLAHCVAGAVRSMIANKCSSSFTEKDATAPGGWILKRSQLRAGSRVLVVEDVITTGGSVEATVQAVERAGGNVVSVVAALVNRSGLVEVDGRTIVALINESMSIWPSDECPLCQQGSEAIRPKGAENWMRLNANY